MNYNNIKNIKEQEIAGIDYVSQPEPPINSHQKKVNRKRQEVENRFLKSSREIWEISDRETVIMDSKNSLLSNNNIHTQQMKLIKAKGKDYLKKLLPVPMQTENTVLHTRAVLLPMLQSDKEEYNIAA